MKLLKVAIFSLALAVSMRFISMGVGAYQQDSLTRDLCNLVSLPLETGVMRDTYDGLISALHARGEMNACVSVTDNGRGFSPDCMKESLNYRTVQCKAVGNTGMRASISYVVPSPFDLTLALWWLGALVLTLIAVGLTKVAGNYLAQVFSQEVSTLLDENSEVHAKPSGFQNLVRGFMRQVGISEKLEAEAKNFREKLLAYEYKVAEEALKRSRVEQEAEVSRRFIESVRVIRHDIRSPLSALQAVYGKIKDNQDATARVLATAMKRIQTLSDNLGETIGPKEEKKLVIAEVAAEETVLMLKEKFSETKGATLSLSYSEKSLSPIMVAPKEFQSALENLLENALEAIPYGGFAAMSITQTAGKCRITVRDNGPGIPEEKRSQIFTKGGSFGKVNGLGLGLHSTKHNVESWGGRIGFTVLEVGTEFSIEIPVLQAGVVFSGLPEEKTIAVIDDDPQVAVSLEKAGFTIIARAETFKSGAGLLSQSTAEGQGVMIDNRLGEGLFGIDLIADQGRRKGVYLCTNDYDDLDLIHRARALGVKIVPKPLCFTRAATSAMF